MRHDGRTREYVARRTVEGKSKREIMRCLKRYIAREIYHLPTGADGCGVCAISTEVSGNIAEHLKCPNLNIGASDSATSGNTWKQESADCGSREGRGFEPRRSPSKIPHR